MSKIARLKTLLKTKVLGQHPWEEQISLNSFENRALEALPEAGRFVSAGALQSLWSPDEQAFEMPENAWKEHIQLDPYSIPPVNDREGYYGENHLKYWASGFREMKTLTQYANKHSVEVKSYLDLGCATGRVLRHFACQCKMRRACGVDINRRHIDWIVQYLPSSIEVAQTTSVPYLPFEDNTFDLVSAFSVFTHIEAFETAWLMEIRRVLRSGGLAWITIHSENTWKDMKEGWPLYDALLRHPNFQGYSRNRTALPQERMIFRQSLNRSYSSNVFYSKQYVIKTWGRLLEPLEFLVRIPDFQDVLILKKR